MSVVGSFCTVSAQRLGSTLGKETLGTLYTRDRSLAEKFKNYSLGIYRSVTIENVSSFVLSTTGTIAYMITVSTPASLPLIFLYSAGGAVVNVLSADVGSLIGEKVIRPIISKQEEVKIETIMIEMESFQEIEPTSTKHQSEPAAPESL